MEINTQMCLQQMTDVKLQKQIDTHAYNSQNILLSYKNSFQSKSFLSYI